MTLKRSREPLRPCAKVGWGRLMATEHRCAVGRYALRGELTVRVFRIAIPVSDISLSRDFYARLLGVDADDTVPSRIYFHLGDVILAIIDWKVEPQGQFRPIPEHLYLSTEDVEAAYERAKTVGALNISALESQPWGERSFYCADPDGNLLCFVADDTLFLGRGAEWS
jgi:catechol 2,3-dioxygenase-like lactoylglutathione lyase family enzyme